MRDEGSDGGTFLFLSSSSRDKHAVIPGDIFAVGSTEFGVAEIILEQTLHVRGVKLGSIDPRESDGLLQAEHLGRKLLGVPCHVTVLESEDQSYVKVINGEIVPDDDPRARNVGKVLLTIFTTYMLLVL